MASKSETGHAVNLANFKVLIDACGTFGAAYNPANARLSVATMTTQWTSASTDHTTLNQNLMAAKPTINSREILFNPLSKLITRVISSLNSTDASPQIKADAKGLADKIRGFGLSKPKAAPPADGTTPPDADFVSKSHLGFVQRADNFKSLIELLKTEPAYTPNEADLTTASLATLYVSLKTANDGMGTILKGVEKKRISRDKSLYTPNTGIIDTATKSKDYVKSIFGATSPEYKMVKGLKFRTTPI